MNPNKKLKIKSNIVKTLLIVRMSFLSFTIYVSSFLTMFCFFVYGHIGYGRSSLFSYNRIRLERDTVKGLVS